MQKQWIVVLARKRHCFLHIEPNRAPPPQMSIFSLVKGGKEHEVFEMRMCERGALNSYKVTCKESEVLSWIGKHQKV